MSTPPRSTSTARVDELQPAAARPARADTLDGPALVWLAATGRGPAVPSVPGLPDAERLLGEVLAAARDTVARCEHALALVAAHRGVVPSDLAPAAWHADAAACAHAPTTSGACSNGSAPPAIASNGAASAAPSIMTPRETEVVRLIAAGLSNKEIAGELCVSVRTIEHHIANVYRKIGARGKADATAWAVRQHLV